MGYTTEFTGHVTVDPPLNHAERAYLKRFAESRRMNRERGPYYCGAGPFGQDREPDITDYNRPGFDQPGLWCKWEPTEDGTAIEWNGMEKFYDAADWMRYLIDTFLKPSAALAAELTSPVEGRYYAEEFAHFTFNHFIDGTIDAQGENDEDRWQLVVSGNTVTVIEDEDTDAIPAMAQGAPPMTTSPAASLAAPLTGYTAQLYDRAVRTFDASRAEGQGVVDEIRAGIPGLPAWEWATAIAELMVALIAEQGSRAEADRLRRVEAALVERVANTEAELAEFRTLFATQGRRMTEATNLWRSEDPAGRANTLPDLGDLLAWLVARAGGAA